MMKFKAKGEDGSVLYGFGITERNVRLLKQDKPILIQGADIGLPKEMTFCIFYGDTEKAIFDMMKSKGWIDDKTQINDTSSEEQQDG